VRARALACGALLVAGCSGPVSIDVQLVNPCNQDAIGEVDFLRFEPQGQSIDSTGLTSIQRVSENSSTPIAIPLAADFRLVVTGHRDSFESAPAGLGVSSTTNLTTVEESVLLQIPFALIDRYYKTTNLADPVTCTNMETSRYGHTATWVPAAGVVVLVGGITETRGTPEYRKVVEVFDPSTGTFSVAGELKQADTRAYHTATLLGDNRVLVAGGVRDVNGADESMNTAVIIEMKSNRVARIGEAISMKRARVGHTAAKLSDGRVMLLGGRTLDPQAVIPENHDYVAAIEIFDPESGLFLLPPDASGTGVIELDTARYGHSSTVLDSGQEVLVAGGFNSQGPQPSVEVVIVNGNDVTTVTAATAGEFTVGSLFHAAVRTKDGHVLLAGGYAEITDAEPRGAAPTNPSESVEIWDYRPTDRRLARRCVGRMNSPRGYFTATRIGPRVLFAGGHKGDGASTTTSEVVHVTGGPGCFATTPSGVELADGRARHTATVLPSGEVLVAGGLLLTAGAASGQSTTSTEIFSPAREP